MAPSYVPADRIDRPVLLATGIGNSHEAVTTTSPEAQRFYDQGLNYQESYVRIEAARSFRQALRLEPNLAMAYVGLSRVYSGLEAPETAKQYLERAKGLASGISSSLLVGAHCVTPCLRTLNGLYSVRRSTAGITMRYSTQIRPISYLKANAAEVLEELREQRRPLVITQNGEAKAVIQDVASYEETQETLALLKVLALGNQQIEQGKVKAVGEVVNRLRARKTAD